MRVCVEEIMIGQKVPARKCVMQKRKNRFNGWLCYVKSLSLLWLFNLKA